jgi:hypothetical protein
MGCEIFMPSWRSATPGGGGDDGRSATLVELLTNLLYVVSLGGVPSQRSWWRSRSGGGAGGPDGPVVGVLVAAFRGPDGPGGGRGPGGLT